MEVEELLTEKLPGPWNYGVTLDGRVFFVNEESRFTTWLHPVSKHSVQSGQSSSQDLPRGWEYAYTGEGVPYFIDHCNQITTFQHPRTGEVFAIPISEEEQHKNQIPESLPPREPQFQKKQQDLKRQSTRKKSTKSKVVKAPPEPKRNFSAPVNHSGWLYKQESGGLKNWKRRWFVVSDFCLFIYKDSSEKDTQGAISLPSYKINPCINDSNINRKYAFKAEHQNLKTHYFAGENEIDTKTWMNVLSLATIAQTDPNIEKQYQERKEADEEAGFETPSSDKEQGSMKRFSSNDIFPPQPSRSDPRFGQGHYNPNYPHELSDSQSQGSSGNRNMDLSGSYGHTQRDTRQHGYPGGTPIFQQRPSYTQDPNMDRSANINDPYQSESPQWNRDPRQGTPQQNNIQQRQYDPHRIQSNPPYNQRDQNNRSDNRQTSDRFNNQRGTDPRYSSMNQRHNHHPDYKGDIPQPSVQNDGYNVEDQNRYEQNQMLGQDPKHFGYNNQRIQDPKTSGYDSRHQTYMNHQGQNQNIPPRSDPMDHHSRYPVDQRQDPASDPRNMTPRNSQQRYSYTQPQHGGLVSNSHQQPKDRMFSERPIDVPSNNSQKSDSVSDDGGFKQDRGRPWKGPNDFRSDPPQSYRNSYTSDSAPPPQQQTQYGPPQNYRNSYTSDSGPPQQQYGQRQQHPAQQYQPTQQFSGPGSTQQLHRGQPPRMSSQSSRSTGSIERTTPSEVIRGYAHPFPPTQQRQESRQTTSVSTPSSNQSGRVPNQNQLYHEQSPNIHHSSYASTNQSTPHNELSSRSNDPMNRSSSHGYGHEPQGINGNPRHFEPLTIDTSPIHEPAGQTEGTGTPLLQADSSRGPGHPPLPADMMPKYVEELAETRTPSTRNDMMTSMEISMQRKEKERLFFQYPEVAPKVADEQDKTNNNKVVFPPGDGFSMSSEFSPSPPPLPARNSRNYFYNNSTYFDHLKPVAFNKLEYSKSFNVSRRDYLLQHSANTPSRHASQSFGSYERSKSPFLEIDEEFPVHRSENNVTLPPKNLFPDSHGFRRDNDIIKQPFEHEVPDSHGFRIDNAHKEPSFKHEVPDSHRFGINNTGKEPPFKHEFPDYHGLRIDNDDTEPVFIHDIPNSWGFRIDNDDIEPPLKHEIPDSHLLRGQTHTHHAITSHVVRNENDIESLSQEQTDMQVFRNENYVSNSENQADRKWENRIDLNTEKEKFAHYQVRYTCKDNYTRSTEELNKSELSFNDNEEIYVAIDDDYTYSSNIGTSQSYTLPEHFDLYEDDYSPGNPWYRSSDSVDEDEDPYAQRDSKRNSYSQNKPGTDLRQRGNEMLPSNRYRDNSQQPGYPTNQQYSQPHRPGSAMSDKQRVSEMVGHRDRVNPHRSDQSPYVGRKQYDQEVPNYGADDHTRHEPVVKHSYLQQSPPSPMSDSRSLGGTSNPYAELSTVQRASHSRQSSNTKEHLPALPSRPPPRRVTSPPNKTAAQELKQLKRKSGDYSQEIQDKEEQRLNKHIAASFKRLSLGNELGIYSEFSRSEENDNKDMTRRSLDWEVENSLFGSNLDKYTQETIPYGYNNQKFSTPNIAGNFHVPGSYYENGTINDNVAISGAKGFSDFVQTSPETNNNVYKSYESETDGHMMAGSFKPPVMTLPKEDQNVYPMKESYNENDNVVVVEMDENSELNTSKDIMEDIDQDVVNIKNRISSLRNLLDSETQRMSPVPDQIITSEQNYQNVASLENSSESYPDRSTFEQPVNVQMYSSNQSDQSENKNSYERQTSFGSQRNNNYIRHDRQSSLPNHQRQASYERPPSFGKTVNQPSQQHWSDKQNSFSSNLNHTRQSSLGLPPTDRHRQKRPGSLSESKNSSRQSSFSNLGKSHRYPQAVPKHRHQASLDGSQSLDVRPVRNPKAKGWKSLGQLEDNVPSRAIESTQEKYRNDPWNKTQPASTLLEWKLSGPSFTAETKDDSILLDHSRSERAKHNVIHLQSRPMSYAEGLKPPLTKLEKLELENKISRSMGAINVQDLEKETSEYLDDQGFQRPGYDPEWEVIQKVLKREEPPMEFPPRGNQFNTSQPPAPTLPPKSPGMGRRNITQPVSTQNFEIGAIKEDPDMPDTDVLETRKLIHIKPSLDAQRLRLSISAGDLIGKSHEELVLLLIQLRRAQSRLEGERNYYQSRLGEIREGEKEYKLKRKNSVGRLEEALEEEHEQYMTLKRQHEEVEKQLEVHKPLVNLVDNMVTMGSLYGGDNLLLASQYKRHKLRPDQYQEPKEMIEFSRKYQEQKFVKEQEEELKKLTDEEIELEEKLQQLFELDKLLQEKSFSVTNLQENKEHLERAFDGVKKQEEWETDPREHRQLAHQKKTIEQELTTVRQQLADASRDLEETAAENAKVEHEVILLRKKVYGLNKNLSSPTVGTDNMKTRAKLERELDKVTAIMEGLNKQGAKLQKVMNTLHKPEPVKAESPKDINTSTYMITDLDTMTTEDMAKEQLYQESTNDINKFNSDQSFKEPPHVQRAIDGSNRDYGNSSEQNVPESRISPTYTSNLTWSRGDNKYDVNQNSLKQQRSPSNYQQKQYLKDSYDQNMSNRQLTQVEPQYKHNESLDSGSSRPMYSPMDISQADENTKRFFGILPKEKPKGQTLRDVKKREFERRSRERMRQEEGSSGIDSESDADVHKISAQALRKRSKSLPRRVSAPWGDPKIEGGGSPAQIKSFDDAVRRPRRKLDPQRRKSAIERLFPGEMPPTKSQSAMDLNSEVHVKRMSNIFTPKPFGTPNSKSSGNIRQVSMSGYRSVSMSNPNMIDNQNKQPAPINASATNLSHPSPQYLDSSLPREGEPQDVQPDLMKPQVTFAPQSSSLLNVNKTSTYGQQAHRASPVTVATVYPVPNVNTKIGYSSSSRYNPVSQTQNSQYSSSGTDYSSSGNVSNFMQQFNTWKQNKQNPTATVRPLSNNNTNNSSSSVLNSQESKRKPKSALKTKRGAPRRQTISSSQPMWFESPSDKKKEFASEAGDLIRGTNYKRGVVRAESLQDLNFDDETIDRMVLYTPQKVDIPERYVPDSDDESITAEEKLFRQEKADKVRKLVIAQSLQDWKEDEIVADRGENIHRSIKAEKQRREHLLDIRQALAKEVTQKSKEVAVNRKKAQTTPIDQYSSDSDEQPALSPPRYGKSFYA